MQHAYNLRTVARRENRTLAEVRAQFEGTDPIGCPYDTMETIAFLRMEDTLEEARTVIEKQKAAGGRQQWQ